MEHNKEIQRIAKLAVNLTHEFTTPMSVLVATLEELQRSETDDKKRMQLDVALRNAYKYRALTNDVFSISRVLSGSVLFRMAKTNLVDFIENIVSVFHTAANHKKVELQFISSTKEIECYFDYQKLYRVIYRLLANGIRFMKPEGGILKISLFYLKEQHQVRIEIWDNGIGIVPEKVPHVFDVNYDEDPIHLAYYQSTSIGLYLTKLFTQLMGGAINVESEKFKYTRFNLQFPVYTNPNSLPFEHVEILEDISIDQLLIMEEVLQVDTDEILQIKLPKEGIPLVVVSAKKKHEEFWKSVFKDDAELVFITSVDIALGHILDLVPDLIVVEQEQEDMTGSDTIQYLKKNSVVNHVPMVLYLPNGRYEQGIDLMAQSKADEVITETTDNQSTRKRLNNLIENRKKVFEAAWQQAMSELKQTKSLSLEDSFLSKINGIIDRHIADEDFSVDQLSDEMFMSRTQIHRKLKAITNQSTTQYIKRYKLKKALKDIEAHTGTISEIAYKYGFSSPAYFSRVFQEIYGKKPSEVTRNDR